MKIQNSKFKNQKDFSHNIFLKYSIIFLFIIILLPACENKSEISEDTLVKIYTDVVIAQDTSDADSLDFTEVNQAVFNRYNVTAEDYRKSIMLLNEDAERWQEFFDKVIKYAENLKRDAEKND